MKTYNLNNGVWEQLFTVPPTQEQLDILNSEDTNLNSQKVEILAKLNFTKPVKDPSKLNSLYQEMIPKIDGEYEFLSLQLSEDKGEYFGILNCRVNGEHIQVRIG